jgi:uncharacterized protein (DUF1810 family)/uncharacterized protein YheU (UPF0270 family)
MWFVFPQLDGLALSTTSKRYAIKSIEEAKAYLKHPILGARLLECMEALISVQERSAVEIFGTPDDLKLRSCATLFAIASSPNSVFVRVLEKYYHGVLDEATLKLLSEWGTIDLEGLLVMRVPHTQLSAQALRAVVEEFVTRNGTDYSSIKERVVDVLRQLDRGDVELHFDDETKSCNILPPKRS